MRDDVSAGHCILHQRDFKSVFQDSRRPAGPALGWTIHSDSGRLTVMASDAWQRLAELLVARRVELGYANRTKFSHSRWPGGMRIIAAVENQERQNFEAATIAQIELAYEWEPGSVRQVLAGGQPTPKGSGEVRYVERVTASAVDPLEIEDDAEAMQEFLRQRSYRKRQSAGRHNQLDTEQNIHPDPPGPEHGS